MHQFLSDQQLTDLEERYKSLKKLLMIDMEALITEVRTYKELTSDLQVKLREQSVEFKPTRDWDHLPSVLTPLDIEKILLFSKPKVYKLLSNPPFQVRRIGRLLKIPREPFLEWLVGNDSEA